MKPFKAEGDDREEPPASSKTQHTLFFQIMEALYQPTCLNVHGARCGTWVSGRNIALNMGRSKSAHPYFSFEHGKNTRYMHHFGIHVDPSTVLRWVQFFALIGAALRFLPGCEIGRSSINVCCHFLSLQRRH